MYKLIFYSLGRRGSPVVDFINELPKPVQAKTAKLLKRLEEFGPQLPFPYASYVGHKLYELRVSYAHDEVRLLYFFYAGMVVVITNGFRKKQNKLPAEEIERAMQYKADFIIQQGETHHEKDKR